jgi:Flp pilus assembly protein TadG
MKREDGQSIITIALMSFFLLAVLAVVVESSAVYIQRRNLQNAADAAALAGAQSLDGTAASETPAETAALNYKDNNISGSTFFLADARNNYTEIEVTVKKRSATAFAGWMSFGEPEVTAKATARIAAPLLPGPGVVPLAIDLATYNNCIQGGVCAGVTLKEESGNNSVPRNSYGLLDLGGVGGGASEVREFFVGGSTVGITDPDNEKQGNVSSMRQAVEDRMTAAAHNGCLTLAQVTDSNGVLLDRCNPLAGAGRGADSAYPNAQPTAVIVIPVITDFSGTGCTGSHCVDIVGSGTQLRTFAIFLVDETTYRTVNGVGPTCADNGQCWITGQFILTHLAPVSTQFNLPTGTFDPDALLKIVQLID